MPCFFFDTYDGNSSISDDEGIELDSLEAAKAEAQKSLSDMAKDELPDGDQRTFIVSIRDEAEQVVLRVALSLVVEYPTRAEG